MRETTTHEFTEEDEAALVEPASPEPEDAPEEATEKGPQPIRYSAGLATRICERIALGDPLQTICSDEAMPTVKQVQAWIRKYAAFEEAYEQARMLQADYLADEMLVIAAELRKTTVPAKASALRAAADLIAKQAEWRAPRKYGPKMDLNINERQKTPDEIKAEIVRLRTELGVPEGRIARIK